MEILLNRWRGTGIIFSRITGTMIYALYIGLLFGLLSTWYIGLLSIGLFLLAESMGWGKWVGALVRYEPWDEDLLKEQYKDDEGKKFPFIHQTANFLVPERIEGSFKDRLLQYKFYAVTALTLRGIYWWLPVYLVIATLGLITFSDALLVSAVLGVSFPLACIIGKRWKFTKKYGILSFSRGWENQEIIYGLIQGLVFWSVILF